ncbi:MAG: hypothetical protein IT453_01560 [Planctomycetes bacterium]|nr:hypothetical protein [Planctomycetota bacterium]
MNKTVLGALAVLTASSLGFAGSTDGEYMTLDRELENLATSLTSSGPGGVGVSAFIRVAVDMVDQDVAGAADDELGVTADNMRVVFDADAGAGYGFHVAVDAAGGTADLVDGYGTFKVGEQVKGTLGLFRAPFLWQGWVDENHLLFNDHLAGGYTLNGLFANGRDLGAMFSGNFEQIGWAVAVQNGSDSLADEHRISGRATFTAMGKGVGLQEGAYNSTDEQNLTVGVGFTDDGFLNDGTAIGGDVVFTQGPLYAHAQIADYDKDLGDNTPWDVTVSYMVSPNEWEVAGRIEDWDDANDTTHFAGGVTYYANGHNAKWTLQFDSYNSDGNPDGTALALSLILGA